MHTENTLAGRLKAARITIGATQAELARQLGLTTTTVWRWEKGLSEPDIDTSIHVASLAGLKLEWLLTGEGPLEERQAEEENALLSCYRRASGNNKGRILAFAIQLS